MNKYLINKFFDNFFILYSPIFALLALIGFDLIKGYHQVIFWFIMQGLASTTTLFRGYLNINILKKYWFRLLIVPFLLWGLLNISVEILVFFIFVEIIYDIWHSSLQTWGIGRIYDSKMNNNNLFRQQDRILNLFIYAGPLFAGLNLLDVIGVIKYFKNSNFSFLFHSYNFISLHSESIKWMIVISGIIFLLYYSYYFLNHKKEYNFSTSKYILFLNTSITCISCGFVDNYGMVYVILNIFHSMQTFGVAYFAERKNLIRQFKLNNIYKLILFVLISISFLGAFEILLDYGSESFYNLVKLDGVLLDKELNSLNIEDFLDNKIILHLFQWRIIASIIHYWSDSFIWSISKKEFLPNQQ